LLGGKKKKKKGYHIFHRGGKIDVLSKKRRGRKGGVGIPAGENVEDRPVITVWRIDAREGRKKKLIKQKTGGGPL